MQKILTEFACDNCKRTIHKASLPVGWASLTIQREDSENMFENIDVCETCVEAIVVTMGKRRRVEGGRYREPQAQVHNLPTPETADGVARQRWAAAPSERPAECSE